MKVVIVGCGRVGATLAYQLSRRGNQVTVIDQDAAAFDNLPPDFRGRTIEGDVLARNVLHRAQIEEADALAALTRSDSLNALVAHIARAQFGVKKVIAGNADPRQRPLQEAFDIPVIGAISWGAQRFMELISDTPLRAIHVDDSPNPDVYQYQVPESWRGQSWQDLLPTDQVRVIAVVRDGFPLSLSDDLTLDTDDLVYLTASSKGIEALEEHLGLVQQSARGEARR